MYYVGLTIIEDILDKEGELAALKQASTLKCLGKYRDAIQTGWAATSNANFYREIGKDPHRLLQQGIKALRNLLEENKAQAPTK